MISMFSSLRYFWSEAFKSLFRNQFMAIASVLTVTVSMFILGGFLCVVLNINHMASYLENQVEMTKRRPPDRTGYGCRRPSQKTSRHKRNQFYE